MRLLLILVFVFLSSMPLIAFASENVITVKHGDESFEVPTSLTNGDVRSITVDPDFKSIILQLEGASGELTINLPRTLIDSKKGDTDDNFIVVLDNNEVTPEEIMSTEAERELKITIPQTTKLVEIIGTNIIPEFPFVLLILISGTVLVILTTRTRMGPK